MTPTHKKSLICAIVFMAGLVLASLFGAFPYLEDLFSEETLTANHEAPVVEPEDTSEGTESEGLRHEVSIKVQAAQVLSIVDGDTIEVSFSGAREMVRLIGINTPESVSDDESKNTAEGMRAAEHMASMLHPGDIVYLQRDITDRDEHNRLLRYVWIREPENFSDIADVRTSMVNARMLADGYAVAHKFKPDDAYFEIFKTLQLDALHAERGLWENGVGWSQGV